MVLDRKGNVYLIKKVGVFTVDHKTGSFTTTSQVKANRVFEQKVKENS